MADQDIFLIDEKKEPFAFKMQTLGVLKANEIGRIEKINPNYRYTIKTFDENNEPNGERKIYGEELRAAVVLHIADVKHKKLEGAALKAYNLKVYEDEEGAKTQTANTNGAKKLKTAAEIFFGYEKAGFPKGMKPDEPSFNDLLDEIRGIKTFVASAESVEKAGSADAALPRDAGKKIPELT